MPLTSAPVDDVGQPVVAVHDGRRALRGHGGGEPLHQLAEFGARRRLRRLPLGVPPLDLAGEVPVGAAEVGQADARRIDGVQFEQGVHQLLARPPGQLGGRAPPVCRAGRTRPRRRRTSGRTGRRAPRGRRRAHRRPGPAPSVPPSALITRNSRAISCALGSTCASSGRRSAHTDSPSVIRYVRLDLPPAISSPSIGPCRRPGRSSSSHCVSAAKSTPGSPFTTSPYRPASSSARRPPAAPVVRRAFCALAHPSLLAACAAGLG